MEAINKKGKAVVTGASGGLGAVFAERLANRGYDLILIARRADRLNEAAQRLSSKYGVKVDYITADLGNMTELENVASVLSNDDQITMLVNNAGTLTLAAFIGTPVRKNIEMINVNITAVTVLTEAVLPGLKARNAGILINIGSCLGFHSLGISAVYSGTKGFVTNFTRGLQEELKDTNVFVQLVLPAATATDIWEVGGYPLTNLDPSSVMTAENCVDATLSGMDQREYITLPSVEDYQLQDEFEAARVRLFEHSQISGKPASRYNLN